MLPGSGCPEFASYQLMALEEWVARGQRRL